MGDFGLYWEVVSGDNVGCLQKHVKNNRESYIRTY